jgi:hypothetical protein
MSDRKRRQPCLPVRARLLLFFQGSLALVIAGCKTDTSPYDGLGSDPCAAGNVRTGDEACVMPAASGDGGETDFDSLAILPVNGTCTGACEPRPSAIQIAQRSSPTYGPGFEVHLILDSAPPSTDKTIRYVLQMTPVAAYPATTSDALAFGAAGMWYAKSGTVVNPGEPTVLPYSATWTFDGAVFRVPRALVATRAGAQLSVGVERLQGAAWVQVFAPSGTAPACWEWDARVTDPCRGSK